MRTNITTIKQTRISEVCLIGSNAHITITTGKINDKPSSGLWPQLNFVVKFTAICLTLMVVLTQQASAQRLRWRMNVTPTFAANNSLTALAGWIGSVPGNNAANGPSPMTFQWQTGQGAAAVASGALINGNLPNAPVPPAMIPFPAPVPAAVAPLGNSLVVTYNDGAVNNTWTMNWKNTAWFWGTTPGIVMDPNGAPGITPQQTWNFVGPLSIAPTSAPNTPYSIADDNFDLSYTDVGGGLYQAYIADNNSYIDLADSNSDVDRLAFPSGSLFGTLQYNSGSTTDGVVDFSAIGLTGTFHYDLNTDTSTITSSSLSAFNADQFTATPAPEPTTLALVGLSGLTLLLFRRQRK